MKVDKFDDFLNLQCNFIPGGKLEYKSYTLLVIFILMSPSNGSSIIVKPLTELPAFSSFDEKEDENDEFSEFYCKLSSFNP